MEEEKKKYIRYKLVPGEIYTVNRNDYGNHTFYKIQVSKINMDESKDFAYKIVSFSEDVDIQDGTKIRINNGYESFYMKDKFNAIFTVVITDFDVVTEEEPANISDAIANYNNEINNGIGLPF